MFKHILFPSDLSATTIPAFQAMLDLAKRFQAHVTLFHAYDIQNITAAHLHDPTFTTSLQEIELAIEEKARQNLENFKKQLDQAHLISEVVVVKGHPGALIVATASNKNCDLIVMGSRGLGPVNSFLLGSKSTYVLHHSQCPVLILPVLPKPQAD